MWFMLQGEEKIVWILVAIGLLVAWGIGCGFKSVGGYFALAFLLGGGASFFVFQRRLFYETWGAWLSLYCILVGFGGLIMLLIFYFKRRKRERLEKLGLNKRYAQYTLPQRDNTFIRARLNTALRDSSEEAEGLVEKEKAVKVAYIKELMNKLKQASLSPAERLEAEDTAKLFFLCLEKSEWTSEELRTVNDIFSYFLKLSAKYAV